MQTRWATVGGIMSIISGALGILCGLIFIFLTLFFNWLIRSGDPSLANDSVVEGFFALIITIYGVIGIGYFLLGVLAIIGGIFSIRRKVWGLALAGAIASIFTFLPTGVVAVVFTVMGRSEFLSPESTLPASQV
jgi:hypothetical protein